MDRGETDGALETLLAMQERHPHNSQVLRLLQRLHLERGDWSALIRLLPDLRKGKVLPPAELAALEQRAWGQNLSLATTRGEDAQTARQALERAWQQLTAAQRQEPQLVLAYAEQLRQVGAQSEAEHVLRTALKREYESHLARLYGLVRGDDPARQLQTAEGWLKAHPQDASLLLTLGRLSLQNRLWGKARDYLESSLRMERNPRPVPSWLACSRGWARPSAATSCSRRALACWTSACWRCLCPKAYAPDPPQGPRQGAGFGSR
jgi:HemY protein